MMVYKIYCAGPLFNLKEQEQMFELAQELEKTGFDVFLPHKDGIELTELSKTFDKTKLKQPQIDLIISKAIFALDVFQVLDSDGLVLNLNGRVPDEGAMVEAGIAWSANKKIVLFKNDTRTMLNGADNPLVRGLSNFVCVSTPEDVANKFKDLVGDEKNTKTNLIPPLKDIVSKGETVYKHIDQKCDFEFFTKLLFDLFKNEDDTL